MKLERGSGILLHITSLPGRFGIGDFGRGAYAFIDFLASSGQSYWQFLPLTPVAQKYANSPYKSPSAFAGNPLLIDLEQLVEDGLLKAKDLAGASSFSEYDVDFEKVSPFKYRLLGKAFDDFDAADSFSQASVHRAEGGTQLTGDGT